jgi:ketosteroid isomerase-like protein
VLSTFDFAAFRNAVETRDADRWAGFYDDDAEWLEYRHSNPPRAPNVMRGRKVIDTFIRGVSSSPLGLTIEHEVLDDRRAGFTLVVTREDGRRIVENVILEHRDGRIVRQIDVEAWD